MKTPDFYLIPSEGFGLDHPIGCFKRKKLYGKNPNGYLLCDIKPSLIGQHYGKGSKDITQLVLASRHQGYSLFPITEWPSYVYVTLLTSDNLEIKEYISDDDIKLIGWGELYPSEVDAINNL